MCRWHHPFPESEGELKSLLMKVKEKSEKAGLQVNILVRSWHPVPSFHGKYKGKKWKQWQILFFWVPKSLQRMTAAMQLKDACSLEGKLWQTQPLYSKQRHLFNMWQGQSYGFSSSHVQMWQVDWKEGWAPKNRWFWTVVLEKTLENPLESKELKPKAKRRSWHLVPSLHGK